MLSSENVKQIASALIGMIRRTPKQAALAAMSDVQLINKINYDAEDGRINTAYSEEYDRRRAQRNKESK